MSGQGPRKARSRFRSDNGQTTILVVLVLGIFLLAAVAFAVDFGNFWFHRQAAQNAADAACTAGAMDMLVGATTGATGNGGFTPPTGFNCAAGSTIAPCWYAARNGYGSENATPGNLVSVGFPDSSSVPGLPPDAIPPVGLVPHAFIRVDVLDRVQTFFSGLITGQGSQNVRAFSVCGVVIAEVPVPLVVLNPTLRCTFDLKGTGTQPKLSILGGPSQSVQVNSNNATAECVSGNSIVDLSKGGPSFTGSDFGVTGGPTGTPPFVLNSGTTPGLYLSPHPPIADPFAQLAAPLPPGPPALGVNGTPNIPYGTNGCPDAGKCTEYSGGYYPNGIQVKNATAIFDPGVYYLDGSQGLTLDANSNVRPSTAVGDGSGGTMFYFATANSVSVASNSGGITTDAFQSSRAQCPGGLPPDSRIGLPATFQGNVLLGPCTGPYGQLDTDPVTGATTPARGMLFFQNRAVAGAGDWSGGGQFLLAGTIYFHELPNYTSTFDFGGNSCSSTYVLGNITTDSLYMHGTPCIKMVLDPYALQHVLKASLLR